MILLFKVSLRYNLRLEFKSLDHSGSLFEQTYSYNQSNIPNIIVENSKRNLKETSFDCVIPVEIYPSTYEKCAVFKDRVAVQYNSAQPNNTDPNMNA